MHSADAGLTESMPGQSFFDALDPVSNQDRPLVPDSDGSPGFKAPELPDPIQAAVPAATAVPTPAPPQQASQESHPPAKRLPSFSLAAMAFSDRSVEAQPLAAKPDLVPSAPDDMASPAPRESAAPPPARQPEMFPVSPSEIRFSALLEPESQQVSGRTTALHTPASPGSAMTLAQHNTPKAGAPDVMARVDQTAGATAQGLPEEPGPQAWVAAERSTSESRSGIAETNPLSAEWPLQRQADGSKKVSNLAETLPAQQDQPPAHRWVTETSSPPFSVAGSVQNPLPHRGGLFQPDKAATLAASRLQPGPIDAPSAQTPALHPAQSGLQPIGPVATLPVLAELRPVEPPLTLSGPMVHPAGRDAGMPPEPRLQSGGLPDLPQLSQDTQTTAQPAAAPAPDPASSPETDHNPASPPKAQQAALAVRDTSATQAAGTADRPDFVTNIAEVSVLPQNPDATPPVLIAMSAEVGLGPQSDDPAPVRAAAPAPLLTAEILRLVRTTPDGPVTLTLRPDELGTLRFEVTQTEHGLHIHLSVEQPQTLDLLRRQGDQLLADLRQAGFAGASLSFAGEGAQDAPPQQRDQPQESLSPSGITPARDNASLHPPRLAPPGTLDLRL